MIFKKKLFFIINDIPNTWKWFHSIKFTEKITHFTLYQMPLNIVATILRCMMIIHGIYSKIAGNLSKIYIYLGVQCSKGPVAAPIRKNLHVNWCWRREEVESYSIVCMVDFLIHECESNCRCDAADEEVKMIISTNNW